MVPIADESLDFAVQLASLDERRSICEHPDDDEVVQVTGPGPSFHSRWSI